MSNKYKDSNIVCLKMTKQFGYGLKYQVDVTKVFYKFN